MRYGMFLTASNHTEMVNWARKYESASFDSLWQAELTSSALIPLAGVAPSTSTIKIGAGVVLAFNHSPVMLALQALDLDVLAGGRFILGLGAGDRHRNNNWYGGRDGGKPVSQMREYVDVLRLAMDKMEVGGDLEYDGVFYQIAAKNFFARSIPRVRARIPIYIAAVKPRMAAMTGELCDGLIGNPLFSPQHVQENILPPLKTGLDRAGRDRSAIEVLGQCFAIIEQDLAAAYRIAAGAMLFSIWAGAYDEIFAAHGFSETVCQVRALGGPGKKDKELDLIPRELIDAFCAVGPIDRVRGRLNERKGLLDTTILAVPNTGTSEEQRQHYRNKILESFSE